MINFAARIQDLQTARDKKNHELDGSVKTFSADHMREQKLRVESDFQSGLVALGNDFSAAEQALASEISVAKFKTLMARVDLHEPWLTTCAIAKQVLPSLTPVELSEFYAGAISDGNVGAQVAVETFQPSFAPDDRTAGAAMLEISSLRKQQWATRTQKQQAALASVESKLATLRDDYKQAIGPLIDERAKTLASVTNPAF